MISTPLGGAEKPPVKSCVSDSSACGGSRLLLAAIAVTSLSLAVTSRDEKAGTEAPVDESTLAAACADLLCDLMSRDKTSRDFTSLTELTGEGAFRDLLIPFLEISRS